MNDQRTGPVGVDAVESLCAESAAAMSAARGEHAVACLRAALSGEARLPALVMVERSLYPPIRTIGSSKSRGPHNSMNNQRERSLCPPIRTIGSSSMLVLFLFLLAWVTPLYAGNQTRSAHTEATLLSDTESLQAGQRFIVALRLKSDPGWHTYWQNPGDSGLATRIQWKLPQGFEAGPILWPAPEPIVALPLTSYGYKGEVLLLSELRAPDSLALETTASITASIEWLECKEECLPGFATLNLELLVKSAASPSAFVQEITEARALLPLPQSDWTLRAERLENEINISLRPPSDTANISGLYFFPLSPGMIEASAPQSVQKTGKDYTLTLTRAKGDTPSVLQGVLVNQSGWRGPNSEKALSVSLPFEAALEQDESTTLGIGWALLLAFVGGLILNVMPCVLPVLSVKILGFVEHAGQGKAWKHGIAFTLGVLLSFWILAGALLALRAGGEGLGWGFQLQSPSFLIILCGLIFLFGLNLFGVFEIGTSLTQAGGISTGEGLRGSFGSGILATVVATPCTAPYMGAALGFAVTQPAWAAMLIFTSLGLWMSAPYLLLSMSPSLLKRVPKPGAWMESFKQGMGFLMMATAVWLVWVLGQQVSFDSVTLVLGFLVVLSFAAWLVGRWGTISRSTRSRVISYTLATLFSLGSLVFVLSSISPASAQGNQQSGGLSWEKFSEARVKELQAQNRAIFIDFTAAWCLSCQVNERVVFSSDEVRAALQKEEVVLLKADWTSRDEEITKALTRFGRSGVPLYVLYGKTAGQKPTILPELLTPGIVLDALDKMR